jgi:hypothetical protein
MNNYTNHVSRAMININDIKYDLLKISELFDGVLQEGLGHMPADMYNAYLDDLRKSDWIHGYEISEIVLKEQSYTYDITVQITNDRTPKKLKIHVGLYKSPWPALAPSMRYTGAGYVAR